MKVPREQILERLDDFEPLPEVLERLRSEMRNESTDARRIAKIVKTDALLYARMIRIANSSYAGTRQEVRNVEQAVALLGLRTLEKIVFSLLAARQFEKPLQSYQREYRGLLKQAIGVGALTELLCHEYAPDALEDAYSAGIMHDIGKLILDEFFPPEAERVRALVQSQGWYFMDAEQETFGIDHATLSARICKQWLFSANVQTAVEHHHRPERILEPESTTGPVRRLTAALHIADAMVNSIYLDAAGTYEQQSYPFQDIAVQELRIADDELGPLYDRMQARIHDYVNPFLSQ